MGSPLKQPRREVAPGSTEEEYRRFYASATAYANGSHLQDSGTSNQRTSFAPGYCQVPANTANTAWASAFNLDTVLPESRAQYPRLLRPSHATASAHSFAVGLGQPSGLYTPLPEPRRLPLSQEPHKDAWLPSSGKSVEEMEYEAAFILTNMRQDSREPVSAAIDVAHSHPPADGARSPGLSDGTVEEVPCGQHSAMEELRREQGKERNAGIGDVDVGASGTRRSTRKRKASAMEEA